MRQKTIKKLEVWLTCEQWRAKDNVFLEPSGGDFEVYASLVEAEQEWTNRSNIRNSREGCKVTPSDIQDYLSENVLIKWYVYTNAEGYDYLIRTILVKKHLYI